MKLPAELLDELGSNVLFVGMGNVLRSDDGVGVHIAQRLPYSDRYGVLVVETGLENHIGKIRALQPTEVVLIDSVHFGREPGYCNWVQPDQIIDRGSNTHNLSLTRFPDFFPFPVRILGIQPHKLSVGEHLSEPVAKCASRLTELIGKWGNSSAPSP